jgi:hypothetical protein
MYVWVMETDTWKEDSDIWGVAVSPEACVAHVLACESGPQNVRTKSRR